MPAEVPGSSEGLGVIAGCRPRIVRIEALGVVVAWWAAAPAKAVTTLARECPRVRLVLGDVIDIGERRVLVFVKVPRPEASRLRE